MAQCIWCTRAFTPRERGRNIYQLDHAGVTICWECSDRYDNELVRERLGNVRAQMWEEYAYTENGSRLPFVFKDWQISITPRTQMKAKAIDAFGKVWRVGWKDGTVTLRPSRT